jgi:hypothetical protein
MIKRRPRPRAGAGAAIQFPREHPPTHPPQNGAPRHRGRGHGLGRGGRQRQRVLLRGRGEPAPVGGRDGPGVPRRRRLLRALQLGLRRQLRRRDHAARHALARGRGVTGTRRRRRHVPRRLPGRRGAARHAPRRRKGHRRPAGEAVPVALAAVQHGVHVPGPPAPIRRPPSAERVPVLRRLIGMARCVLSRVSVLIIIFTTWWCLSFWSVNFFTVGFQYIYPSNYFLCAKLTIDS